MKRLAFLFAILILLLGMAGCENQSSSQVQTGSSRLQSNTSTTVSEPPPSSSTPSSEDAVSGSSAVSSEAPASSAPTSSTLSQTQKAVPEQVKAALNTKVPVLLPKSVPVEKGKSLTVTMTSQTWDYTVSFYGTAQPEEVNSQAASKGTPIATVEGTEYKDATSAQEPMMGNYRSGSPSGPDQMDLGHNIKAKADAGCGHSWLIWNEGRWCIWVDSPNDPAFQNKEYPGAGPLAKDVVEYLDENMLPVPHDIGLIYISNNWNVGDNITTVQWQQNQMRYQVSGKDMMTVLKIAVAMN